jgi:hypothetical protein
MVVATFKCFRERQANEDCEPPLQINRHRQQSAQVSFFLEKCASYESLNAQLQQQLTALRGQLATRGGGTAAADLKDARLAEAEALNEKLAGKVTRLQEEQLRKLEDFKAKYAILQGELEAKSERIRRLEEGAPVEAENNIKLLH